ncbi:MAG: hypothetical protein PQJ50_04115, partial [Spirochaetales bacterium]|nr:hypothetical protein [Spirochaetales bacterium]
MKDICIISEGHLIDSGLLSEILNLILEDSLEYIIEKISIGKTPGESSRAEIRIFAEDEAHIREVLPKLIRLGAYEKGAVNGRYVPSGRDAHAPEGFYSTTNHRTEVYDRDLWNPVEEQRMDAVIVRKEGRYICTKIRDVRKGDEVLCGSDSVRAYPPAVEKKDDGFAFMT